MHSAPWGLMHESREESRASRGRRWLRTSAAAVGIMAVLGASMALRQSLRMPSKSSDPLPVAVEITELERSDGEPLRRRAIMLDDEGWVTVSARNAAGEAVEATVVSASATFPTTQGVARVPAYLGRARVEAEGYGPQWVDIGGSDVNVELVAGFVVSGFVHDAVTALPVMTRLELIADTGDEVDRAVTRDDGFFVFDDVAPGDFEVRGQAPGYLDICADAKTHEAGVHLKVRSNQSLRIPMFPILAGIVVLENATGLDDRVFSHIASIVQTGSGVSQVPAHARSMQHALSRRLSTLDEGQRGILVLGVLSRPDDEREVTVNVLFSGENHGTHRLFLGPVHSPSELCIRIASKLITHRLTIESEIPFRLSINASAISSLPFDSGVHSIDLPRGRHVIQPQRHSLLRGGEWTQAVDLYADQRVAYRPGQPYAWLHIAAPASWAREEGCLVTGPGGSLWCPSHVDFPIQKMVTPGHYRITTAVEREDGSLDETWGSSVEVMPGSTKSVVLKAVQ